MRFFKEEKRNTRPNKSYYNCPGDPRNKTMQMKKVYELKAARFEKFQKIANTIT